MRSRFRDSSGIVRGLLVVPTLGQGIRSESGADAQR